MTSPDGATAVVEILARSGLSKSALSAASGVSRSLLDDYLKGRTQPSITQVTRLADAAGLDVLLLLQPKPRPLPESFVTVLEFGEIFPRRAPRPLTNLGPVWRSVAARVDA